MSFRNRLTLFFVLIVVVPMVAVAFVLFRLIADNENGKADARLAARQRVRDRALPRAVREDANPAALAIGRDPALGQALRAGDRRPRGAAARELLGTRARPADRRLPSTASRSPTSATRPPSSRLARALDRASGRARLLQVSVEEPGEYAALVRA